jgi:hypothetical protein
MKKIEKGKSSGQYSLTLSLLKRASIINLMKKARSDNKATESAMGITKLKK